MLGRLHRRQQSLSLAPSQRLSRQGSHAQCWLAYSGAAGEHGDGLGGERCDSLSTGGVDVTVHDDDDDDSC